MGCYIFHIPHYCTNIVAEKESTDPVIKLPDTTAAENDTLNLHQQTLQTILQTYQHTTHELTIHSAVPGWTVIFILKQASHHPTAITKSCHVQIDCGTDYFSFSCAKIFVFFNGKLY